MISPRILLLLPLLLGACSSKEQSKAPPVMSQKMSDRIAASRKRMGDMNDRSVFDKGMRSSFDKGKTTSGWLGKKSYKSNEYAGTKSFATRKDFQTSTFTGAGNKSSLAGQSFGEAEKSPDGMTGTFETKASGFGSQTASEGSQSYDGADTVFKTGAQRDALRSQIKNDRPQFIRLEDNERTPAYTEDQVRRLLGRK
ncbi:hypothetical protein WJU23_21715 [Prosthecobacter sp. SYSU 5D2]|uniref:hypothetical protein n=1 Tax=Prosthecobacter sp. SYSU 5D2 TaxID=3134134 RepID=UPI0031FF2E8E